MSIADKITRLQTAKTNIANAITTKGGTVITGDGFEEFATDIASIPSGGGENKLKKLFTGETVLITADDLDGTTSLSNISGFQSRRNFDIEEWASTLDTIGGSTFVSCTGLTIDHLPSALTVLSDYAFDGCSNLPLTSLPSGITRIGTGAFRACSKLAITRIPSGVTTISSAAFYNCGSLREITFEGTPTSIATNAFGSTGIVVINCPWVEGTVSGAPWGASKAQVNYEVEV